MEAMVATDTAREHPISRLFTREARTASAEARAGGARWIVELDGPNLGPMLLIYRSAAGSGWRLWGTAVWLNEKIEHMTATNVDAEVTAALENALRAVLGSVAPS